MSLKSFIEERKKEFRHGKTVRQGDYEYTFGHSACEVRIADDVDVNKKHFEPIEKYFKGYFVLDEREIVITKGDYQYTRHPDNMFWNVKAIDKEQHSYKPFETIINDLPVTHMDFTYSGCRFAKEFPPIPETITHMANTFSDCYDVEDLSNIVIHKNIKEAYGICKSCSNLKRPVSFEEGVENIDRAFSYCRKLIASPKIPETVKSMCGTFEHCDKLETIYPFSPSVENIATTFEDCKSLKTYIGSKDKDYDFSNFRYPENFQTGEINTFKGTNITQKPVLSQFKEVNNITRYLLNLIETGQSTPHQYKTNNHYFNYGLARPYGLTINEDIKFKSLSGNEYAIRKGDKIFFGLDNITLDYLQGDFKPLYSSAINNFTETTKTPAICIIDILKFLNSDKNINDVIELHGIEIENIDEIINSREGKNLMHDILDDIDNRKADNTPQKQNDSNEER